MTGARLSSGLLLLAILWLGLSDARVAANAGFQLIVHPQNPVTSIDRRFLSDAYFRRTISWRNGESIRPVDLTDKFAAHELFIQAVMHKTGPQLRMYWTQRIFSGTGVPPPELDSPSAVINYVLRNVGAIGYIPSDVNAHPAKVVQLHD
jgi:hypothetical protein